MGGSLTTNCFLLSFTVATRGTMPQPTLKELAQQGDANAIAALLNRAFEPQGIITKAACKNDSLQIVVEAAQTPNKQEAIARVRDVLAELQLNWVEQVTVYGRQPEDDIPDWHQTFLLTQMPASVGDAKAKAEEPFSLSAFTQMIYGVGESIGNTTSQAGKVMVDTASGVGDAVGNTTRTTGKALVDTVAGVGKAVSDTVWHTGKAMVETASGVGSVIAGVGGTIGSSASQASKTAVKTAVGVGGTAAKRTYQTLSQITEFLSGAPILRKVVDQVDITKAQTAVEKLQQKYPTETSSQIAHRIMLEKAVYAAGTGLATSLVPGAAAALFAVDLTATSALQAEMVYQIAAAYGLNLRDPVRKGEVLTIFGLALGGNQAIRAALELLQNTPVAGAIIGASTNAAMLYAVGYAASRFYAAKLAAESTEETLAATKAASDDYLQAAITQQIVMDQILVHLVLAENPDQSWETILPELETLNLSPASLSVIKAHIKSPPPLEQLLAQLNRDFALPLLAQCERISQRDGGVTSAEANIIDKIAQKFDIDLTTMKQQLVT